MIWDDLRFFVAVAEQGTVSQAARVLGVNYSTVLRRLASLEESYGTQLFERSSSGYELTRGGAEILDTARSIEESFQELDRQLAGRDARLSGVVRVATTDLLGGLLMPDFCRFTNEYPDIRLEMVTSIEPLNLTKRAADVAIRVTKGPSPHLTGRRVARIAGTVYVSDRYRDWQRSGSLENLAEQSWIGWDENHGGGEMARRMDPFIPAGASISCRVDSGTALCHAIRAGMGLGYTWCFVGDSEASFKRVPGAREYLLDLWLLVHPDLAKTPRFRVFLDFMADRIAENEAFAPLD